MDKDVPPGQMSNELRSMLFTLDPRQVGLTKESFPHSVFALIMETGFAEGAVTLSVVADGSTSLYFSTGGGIIGGGAHEDVRTASGFLLSGAQHHYTKAQKVTLFPAPAPGEVIFSFITFNGVHAYTALEDELGSGKDELADLFFAAHNVITALRKTEGNYP